MAQFPETRISLILRLRESDDVQAWREFAEIYAPSVFGLALRKGLQPADAEDVTQEVLFNVARAIQRFEPQRESGLRTASFRTWLSRIARNLIADYFRRKSRQRSIQAEDSWLQDAEACPSVSDRLEEDFAEEYRLATFQVAANRVQQRVNASTWQAFHRTTVEAESASNVAEELGLQIGALYVARSRVMKLLRIEVQRLQRDFGSEELRVEDEGMPDFQFKIAEGGGNV